MLNFDRSTVKHGTQNIISTSGFLTALECTKFVFGWGSAPDPTARAYSAPPGLIACLRGLLLRDRGGEEEGKGRREERGGERKGDGRDRPPLSQISGSTAAKDMYSASTTFSTVLLCDFEF